MFTIFHGFHLVETYHQWKKEHRKNKNPLGLRFLKLFFAIAIPLFLWIAPSALYGLPNLNPVEHRVIAIFAFAALMWLFDGGVGEAVEYGGVAHQIGEFLAGGVGLEEP